MEKLIKLLGETRKKIEELEDYVLKTDYKEKFSDEEQTKIEELINNLSEVYCFVSKRYQK